VLTGIDVSRHQGAINWPAVPTAGHSFAFLKATDGVRYAYVDWFHTNAPRAAAAGLTVGAYHFLLDHYTGEAQARYYVSQVGARFPGFRGVVPIVDIEREADGTTPRESHLRGFVAEFRRLVPGRAMLIYTGRWYWVGVLGNPHGADLGPLWHSEYDGISPISADVANGPELERYGGWNDCLVWQHTSSGRCPGVGGNCDLNIFYGEPWLLAGLAGIGTDQPEDDDEMKTFLHASPWTGIHLVDTLGATWIATNEEVGTLARRFPLEDWSDHGERFNREYIGQRQAGADEQALDEERAQTMYLAGLHTFAADAEPEPEPEPTPEPEPEPEDEPEG
jgi:lysozyme